ncbi:HpcH/HpaI aldolase/citrate lyase family protein [Miniphocaeibacter halophilus]|uniref:CoA ester lyase n=1 Tax=Miniphocaeibacter halophilus TaxID=2931922 RepID=A0AC61MTY5_9FIRM|nr:CoA ester lyase [Miniphocaeibacter halophilus]QQK08100.1 CoA ester lyase [Miniphocaeibacter halophilus]
MSNRTFLFMPGNNPSMILNSDVLGSDVVILDLEDSVSLDEKDSARILVREALKSLPFINSKVTVRINPTDSPYWRKDLEEIIPMNPYGIVIPKANKKSIIWIEKEINNISKFNTENNIYFYLLIEKPSDLIHIKEIVESSNRIKGILLGAEDYCSYMGIKRTKDSKEIEYARFVIATTAKAYNLECVDTPFTDVDDLDGLKVDTEFAKAVGFSGKLSINPKHIDLINEIFSPSLEEIEYAKAIVEADKNAKEKGIGVFSFNGKMVDLPVVRRAEMIIDSAKKWSLL